MAGQTVDLQYLFEDIFEELFDKIHQQIKALFD